jgi:hypothetical protein
MRCVLGLLVLSLSLAATAAASDTAAPSAPPAPVPAAPPADAPALTPEQVAQALHDLSQGRSVTLPSGLTLEGAVQSIAPVAGPGTPQPPPQPSLLPPAPVPVERAKEAPKDDEPARIRISPQAFTTLISEPPLVDDESGASAELLQWRDHLEGKKERRIERGAEVGGLAAIGVRLGGRGQAGAIAGATDELLRSLESWNDEGALVISVIPGSPAERAGLVPGDVIVQYAGIWIDSSNLLVRVASRAVVDREQDVWVWRDGAIERLWLTPIDRRDLEQK